MLSLKDLEFFQDFSEDDESNITGGHEYTVSVEVCRKFVDLAFGNRECTEYKTLVVPVFHQHDDQADAGMMLLSVND